MGLERLNWESIRTLGKRNYFRDHDKSDPESVTYMIQ